MWRSRRRRPARPCPGRSSSLPRSGRHPSLPLAWQLRCRARGAAGPVHPARRPARRSRSAPHRRSAATRYGAQRSPARQHEAPPRSPPGAAVARLEDPPPSSTSTGSRVISRRSSAARARATTSAPSRSTISPATGSRSASASTTGASSTDAPCGIRRRWIASASSSGVVDAEVRRDEPLEARLRAAPVLAARRRGQRGEADVAAAAPVAGDLAERREARVASVRRDPDAVDAGTAGDCHAPAALRPGAEHGEGVVANRHAAGPAARGRRRLRPPAPRRGKSTPARNRSATSAAPREAPAASTTSSSITSSDRLEAEMVRRAGRPAPEREQLAVRAHEREVGLRVAAVDGEHEPPAHRAAPASEHALEQLLRLRPLADERMGEQRLARP